jgi:hypothetical protein
VWGSWEIREKRELEKELLKSVYEILSSLPGFMYQDLTWSSVTQPGRLKYNAHYFPPLPRLATGWCTQGVDPA